MRWTQATKITVITHPRLPSRENLKRMSLDLGWDLKVPMADNTDRIFSIQVSPWYDARKHYNPQLIVQTESGRLFLLDGENGEIIWVARLDARKMFPCATNSHALYAFRNGTLYIFDRLTGKQQLYWYDTKKVKHFGMALTSDGGGIAPASVPPIATPAVDGDCAVLYLGRQHLCLGPAQLSRTRGVCPGWWRQSRRDFSTDRRPNPTFPRVLTNHVCDGSIIWASIPWPRTRPSRRGKSASLPPMGISCRWKRAGRASGFRFNAKSHVTTALARHETPDSEIIYISTDEQMLYAFDLKTGNPLWRVLSGGPIYQKPYVNDTDIYVFADKAGMYRINRQTGEEEWVTKKAHEFLAANRKFIYTRDGHGFLQIQDRNRGDLLASYDCADWRVSVANEWSDRIYLANNDGMMMCLFLHDNQHPVVMKSGGWKISSPDYRKEYLCVILKIDPKHIGLQTWDRETHRLNPAKECRMHKDVRYFQMDGEKKERLEDGINNKVLAEIDPDHPPFATVLITDETVTEIRMRKIAEREP